jgi:MoxR-like ATPase
MYIKRKKHLIFYGNKGTGKNHAVEVLAALFNRPLFSTAINRDTDKMDQLGSKTIVAIETDSGNVIQKVVFEPSIVLEAMEVGGFCLLDEINCADNAVMKLLNGIMDNRRTIEVPGYRSVTADEYFAVIGTMNVGYSGTNKLSPELNDRVARIHFIEHSTIKPILLEACPNANLKLVNICDKVYQEIKRRVDITELLEECLTIRGFIDALEVSDDIPLKRALLRSVADKIDDEQMHEQVVDIINLNVK